MDAAASNEQVLSPLDFPDKELRAFVGHKADYYLSAWRAIVNENKGIRRMEIDLNWAAFFFTGGWLLYRKMYRLTALYFAVLLGVIIFEAALSVSVPNIVWGLTIGMICGSYGNRWYFHHALRVVGQVRSSESVEENRLRVLTKRGGPSVAVLVLFILLSLAILLGAILLGD